MTCIVALKQDGRAYMGGDAACVNMSQYYIQAAKHPKVFRNGEYLIGYTSSFRMGHLLQYKANFPSAKGVEDLMRFMSVEFVDYIRQLFKDNGYAKISDNEESAGNFLVIINNEIFEVDSDYHVNQFIEPYISVGCGMEYALGACHALYERKSPEKVIKTALEAAENFSTGVRGPFTIMKY